MAERIRERLEVKNDDEWKLLQARIEKVAQARRELGLGAALVAVRLADGADPAEADQVAAPADRLTITSSVAGRAALARNRVRKLRPCRRLWKEGFQRRDQSQTGQPARGAEGKGSEAGKGAGRAAQGVDGQAGSGMRPHGNAALT